jgi:pimeloyl-ACP methyl ester carboxylesterase
MCNPCSLPGRGGDASVSRAARDYLQAAVSVGLSRPPTAPACWGSPIGRANTVATRWSSCCMAGRAASIRITCSPRQWRWIAAGFDTFRLNFRDHGDSHHLNVDLFHSCRLPEVLDVVGQVQAGYEDGPVFLAGFSLGGNFALRIARHAPAHGVELEAGDGGMPGDSTTHHVLDSLENGMPLYQAYFVHKWRRSLKIKQALYPDRYDLTRLVPAQGPARPDRLAGRAPDRISRIWVPTWKAIRLPTITLRGWKPRPWSSPPRMIPSSRSRTFTTCPGSTPWIWRFCRTVVIADSWPTGGWRAGSSERLVDELRCRLPG